MTHDATAVQGLMDQDRWSGRLFTGSWVDSGRRGVVSAPASGEVLTQVGLATPADVDAAARRASAVQADWAAVPFTERAAVLRRAGDLWERHADEIAPWLVREAGSIRGKARRELAVAAEECRQAAALARQAVGEVLATGQPRLSLSRRVPVGVVGVIAPFNFPLVLSIRAVAPALALGNAVLLKPDVRTAVSGGVALARIFEEAGLPSGVLQVLPGDGDVGEAVVAHDAVGVIAFTGSTRAGRRVGETAGRLLKRAHLELGGNCVLIVRADADIPCAAAAGAMASFSHAGQVCMAAGRHLVQAAVMEEYVARLAELADRLVVADPAREDAQVGPLIDAGQRDRVHALVEASRRDGSTVVTGGEFSDLFYRPTVVVASSASTPVFAEEVFGPVASVLPYETDEDAARIANATGDGLVVSVLTADTMAGLRLTERIPSGVAHVNDQTIGDEATAPFGGIGESGNAARTGGSANLDAYTSLRWTTVRDQVPHYPG